MKIVEYNDSYALKVADMWNKSNSSWGNEQTVKTAADVIAAESSSGNIKLYLALDNDQVVGYCSFSEYKHDVGASYLPLLNVAPEYHGKKVGKALILKVLEDAISSKWPRFDLFTWSGNIKAMPLYKKCGFFWEKGNSNVHLMNFIPYLHQTAALKVYLDKLDWYNDSKRVIDMEQDGESKNGFDYYRYDFENDKTKLAVEFEKTGRGLRYIETPDYSIEMTIAEHDLVFDNEYNVLFKLINKSKKPLEIKFKGVNNKNIKFEMNESILVTDEVSVSSSFYVGKIEKDQDKEETHPVVEADILINGDLASFKVGIEPKFPIKLKLNTIEYNHVLGKVYDGYLDIENNLNTTETFKITLPSNFVEFKDEVIVKLNSKQKKSVNVKYSLKEYGSYNELALITFGDKSLKKQVLSLFKGSHTSFTGLIENNAYISSGNYLLVYNMNGNSIAIVDSLDANPQSAFQVPRIGLPYSLEFNNAKPVIEFTSNKSMDVIFNSKSFKDVVLIIHIKNNYGVLTVKYELKNNGPDRELSLSIPSWVHLRDCTIPYEGKLLEVAGSDGSELGSISHEKVDENWIYNKKTKYGFTWGEEDMKISDWKVVFDKEGFSLKTGESYFSSNFYISYVHSSLKDFRAFAGSKGERDTVGYLEVIINDGNPFSTEDVKVSITNRRKTEIAGTLCIDGLTAKADDSLLVKPGLKKIELSLKDRHVTYKRLIHKMSGKITMIENDGEFEVSNGELSFKASKKYSDSIYSIQFDGHEWLDSNYPTPKERVWWADFVGGMTLRSRGIEDNTALKEERTVEFVKLKDNFGNRWEGIKISLIIQKDIKLKGLTYDSYYLTLPGVKLIHSFSYIINNSGKLQLEKRFNRYNTLKIDDDPKAVTMRYKDTLYKCNDVFVEIHVDKLALFEGNREYKFGVYNKLNNLMLETQDGFNILFSGKKLTVPDTESKQLPGDFIFFTKDIIEKEHLKDLNNIKFDL